METVQYYHHIETREGLFDSKELPTYIQAYFKSGKSCTSQLLNLTQHIENGYEEGMITVTVFVDISAAYDTVNHRLLIQKLYNTTFDSQLCRVIQNLLSDRRFYVELNNEQSRWIIQENGLPQGSVISPTLFNIYTNNQPILDGTRQQSACESRQDASHGVSSAEQRGQEVATSIMEWSGHGEH